jgi:hypothetical protein
MEKTSLTHLDLCAPLLYSKAKNLPSEIHENEEILLLYELDPAQSCNIEPIRELLLGKLVFSGLRTTDSSNKCSDNLPNADIVLPAGKYLFMQQRGSSAMKQEDWLDMAIEQQKDSLWERYKLTNQLYVRHLYEDGFFVTQLLRPCSAA